MTRRGLLAAGAGAGLVVAGCGAPEEPPPDAELLAPSLAAALALEQAAMRAHVHAVGLVRGANRRLAAELLAEDARHLNAVQALLGRDSQPTAFPDGRDA